jgi:hypothetical protein
MELKNHSEAALVSFFLYFKDGVSILDSTLLSTSHLNVSLCYLNLKTILLLLRFTITFNIVNTSITNNICIGKFQSLFIPMIFGLMKPVNIFFLELEPEPVATYKINRSCYYKYNMLMYFYFFTINI